MNRAKEDSFISDEDDNDCPLCMEEFDLSDKNFKPCLCGYQVCQFCWNNIRNNPNLNGKCPACRRPYSEQTVEFKPISAEEWKSDHQKQARLRNERKQKERERKESESASRRHLSGIRVVQKNLVYVIGLNPKVAHDDLHTTLRGNDFFGQYGPVRKIVISKRGSSEANGIGVYVTYYKKEDAAKCIAAVDGVVNDGTVLKANYGTTKYCSAYLRNQACQNPQCMYLHEPGEEQDSFTRQDLSTYNFKQERLSKQMPMGGPMNRTTSQTNISRVIKPDVSNMERNVSETSENSALPLNVSWAKRESANIATSQQIGASVARSPNRPSSGSTAKPTTSSTSAEIPPAPPIFEYENQRPRSSISAVAAQQLFSNTLACIAHGPFTFALSHELMQTQEFRDAQQLPPFFSFDLNSSRRSFDRIDASRPGAPSNHQSLRDGQTPMTTGTLNGNHNRSQSRYNFSDIGGVEGGKSNPYVAQQKSMMGSGTQSHTLPPHGAIEQIQPELSSKEAPLTQLHRMRTSPPSPPPGIFAAQPIQSASKTRPDQSEYVVQGRGENQQLDIQPPRASKSTSPNPNLTSLVNTVGGGAPLNLNEGSRSQSRTRRKEKNKPVETETRLNIPRNSLDTPVSDALRDSPLSHAITTHRDDINPTPALVVDCSKPHRASQADSRRVENPGIPDTEEGAAEAKHEIQETQPDVKRPQDARSSMLKIRSLLPGVDFSNHSMFKTASTEQIDFTEEEIRQAHLQFGIEEKGDVSDVDGLMKELSEAKKVVETNEKKLEKLVKRNYRLLGLVV